MDCKEVDDGQKAIICLGRYLYRGVISEKDILDCSNGMVTYRYLHAKTRQYRTRTVSGEYFLYLLMLHVLPKGFRRTSIPGSYTPAARSLSVFYRWPFVSTYSECLPKINRKRPTITCPVCGRPMKILRTIIPGPVKCRAVCST